MSAHSDKKPEFIDAKEWETLQSYLKRSRGIEVEKPNNSVTLIRTDDKVYYSGKIGSKSHLLTIPSELGALVQATSHGDPKVKEVITFTNGNYFHKYIEQLLEAHAQRVGKSIQFRVYYTNGNLLLDKKIEAPTQSLSFWKKWKIRDNTSSAEGSAREMYERALTGMKTHFGTSEQFSQYGACVQAGDKLYWTGAYSSPDERLGLHAEMGAAVLALMDGQTRIEEVALVSSKFDSTPTPMCGCCRQFFSEIAELQGAEIKVHSFSRDGEKRRETTIQDLLPHAWSSNQTGKKK